MIPAIAEVRGQIAEGERRGQSSEQIADGRGDEVR